MERDNFYIVLPSNVQRNDGVENKTSVYLTPLAKPMELNKYEWEVALAEFSYPHTWYNINDTLSYIICRTYGEDEISVTTTFPPGSYDGHSLAKELNKCIEGCDMGSHFTYTNGANRLRLELQPDEGIILPEKLAQLMGWETEHEFIYRKSDYTANIHGCVNPDLISSLPDNGADIVAEIYLPQDITPDRCVDLNPTTHHLYIYCNLVDEIMVGNIFSKLLRTVSTRNRDYGHYITRIFTSPHYLPLASSFENYVEISIRDDAGRLIPFESGKVIITLHFRKRQWKWNTFLDPDSIRNIIASRALVVITFRG